MLKRKIEKDIVQWIRSGGRKALLLSGVRQSGKTFIIRECLSRMECDYIEYNLIRDPGVVDILRSAKGVDDLVLKFSLYSGRRIEKGTFFFFDEIQKYKEIVSAVKFLVDDGRYRFVLSGSLLGVEIVNLKSAPVGYLETLTLYPLDFEEFLQVFNVDEKILDKLRYSFEFRVSVDDVINQRLLDIFNLYLIIGGMPAAVDKYRSTGNIDDVIIEHMSIIEQYKVDFTQYETENRRLMISRVYEMIPARLNEKNKRFMIADINRNLRYDRIEDSFVWLWKAGVALPVFNTTEPSIPLLINEKSTLFKLFLSDVGLLTTMYGKSCKLRIVSGDGNINKGAVYENVVATELKAHGYSLYYYNSKKKGELDFVIEHNGKVVPVEVKSGKDYERHSALDNVMKVDDYEIDEAFVFTCGNVKKDGRIVYFPIYMVMFLSDNPQFPVDISVDRYAL